MMEDNSVFPSYHAEVGGLDIHYKCLGEGAPVILLHGAGSDWREWRANLPFLARHFRVLAPDLPGFGLSDPPGLPLTPGRGGAFLKDFMGTLGIPDAHIVGHSLGGALALALALDFPEKVRRVVIIDSAGLGRMSRTGRALRSFFGLIGKARGKNRTYRPSGKSEDWLLESRLQTMKPPVMIMWGGRDPYFPLRQARQAQGLIPDCRLHVFNCTCHAPQREFADEFHDIVYHFLTE